MEEGERRGPALGWEDDPGTAPGPWCRPGGEYNVYRKAIPLAGMDAGNYASGAGTGPERSRARGDVAFETSLTCERVTIPPSSTRQNAHLPLLSCQQRRFAGRAIGAH